MSIAVRVRTTREQPVPHSYYPSEAYVTVDGRRSKAVADQLTTASKARLRRKVGRVSEDDLKRVEAAIKLQLGLR